MADLWPGILREVVDLAGAEAALALAERYGGDKVSIPANPTADSPLARCVGLAGARVLAERYHTEAVWVPLGPQNRTRRLEALVAAGWSDRAIIRKLRVARRTVERARGRVESGTAGGRAGDDRQLSILHVLDDR